MSSRNGLKQYLDFFDLTDAGDKLVEGYSHGMKQKLIISGALLHDPKLVVVDEPMVGLDPKGARQVKQLFRDLCQKGTCVFMSTHSLGIAQAMCDRIGIIQKGEVIALGTLDELRQQADHEHLEDIFLELTGDTHLEQLSGMMAGPLHPSGNKFNNLIYVKKRLYGIFKRGYQYYSAFKHLGCYSEGLAMQVIGLLIPVT